MNGLQDELHAYLDRLGWAHRANDPWRTTTFVPVHVAEGVQFVAAAIDISRSAAFISASARVPVPDPTGHERDAASTRSMLRHLHPLAVFDVEERSEHRATVVTTMLFASPPTDAVLEHCLSELRSALISMLTFVPPRADASPRQHLRISASSRTHMATASRSRSRCDRR